MLVRQRFARLVVLCGWMALLTYWSSQGNLPIDQPVVATTLHGFQHRLAHLAAFALLEELTTAGEHTLVMTTHNLASGLRLGTRVGVLAHGQLVHQQPVASPEDAPDLATMLERLARA